MPECDHASMGVEAGSVCGGCGETLGKFTAPDGRVFTTRAAFEARGA